MKGGGGKMEENNEWTDFMDRLAAASKLGVSVQELKRKQQELEMNERLDENKP